ncbi:MAG: FkbM family methyltransferase, partial [Candidatus Omnitrophica bacterium]|nr:FkbM family methyltransferase [Candidatus Omnitrophota bacterium]
FNINFSQSEKVSIDTIDNYCSENNIQQIDLLKIDVEGHELDVLTGAEKMFKSCSIRIVSFEFGGCNIDTRTFMKDFFDFFTKKNMKIYRITPSGFLCPLPAYNELNEQFRTTNFIATNFKFD